MLVNTETSTEKFCVQKDVQDFQSLVDSRLLVVESNTDSRNLISFLLKSYGAEVITAVSAIEALAVINQVRPQILISVVAMPVIDGYSLIRIIRELNCPLRTIPAIALTTLDKGDSLAFESGFQACLLKPINPDKLIAQIIRLLNLPFLPERETSFQEI